MLLYKRFIPDIPTFRSSFFCLVKYLDKGRIEINLKLEMPTSVQYTNIQ